mmetsp:Transcript_13062/g.28315  ORF Transcript_13062/g.28315 Transcript_13062/m.28315 type:complete len:362 (+) Transcript_13062:52-1137(+)
MTLMSDGGVMAVEDGQSVEATGAEPLPRDTTVETAKPRGGKITAVHDLIAGGVAGSASVVVGHPFDTIKVRMQVAPPASSAAAGSAGMSAAATSFGGVSSLFRGIGAPLSTAAVVNAIIFASYGATSRLWDAAYHLPHDEEEEIHGVLAGAEGAILLEHTPPSTRNQITKNFVCGSIAGLVQSTVICPMEHVKCRLQIQHAKGASDYIYKNSFDAASKIVGRHGVRGIYRGMASTCWREAPGYGFYFVTYDLIRDKIAKTTGRDEHGFVPSFLAGGAAGCVIWSSTFPFDTIKTRIQTAPFDTPKAKLRIPTVARTIVKEEGLAALYRGLSVSLVRAFPVNAIVFPVYGFVLGRLQENVKV